MSEGKHTRSPWVVTEVEDCYCVASVGRYIVVPEYGKVKADNSEADARLIAAAPELLEALEEMAAMYSHAWDRVGGGLLMMEHSVARFDAACEKAFQVIAKAKGEA